MSTSFMPKKKEIGGVRHGQEEWLVSVCVDRVLLTHCKGPFGLPTQQISIYGGCAASVAKQIAAAAKRTTPGKKR